MCGRFADPSRDEIIAWFGVDHVHGHKEPSRNVSPTQQVWVVDDHQDESDQTPVRSLRLARWGLIPSWTRTPHTRPLINARSESLTAKPSFRAAASRRRVIVPALGYYEWMPAGGKKTPFFLHPETTDTVLGFAGVSEWWKVPEDLDMAGTEDGWLRSVAIITRPATDAIGHIHDRMPVVVPEPMTSQWLDPSLTDLHSVDELVMMLPDPVLIPDPQSPTG